MTNHIKVRFYKISKNEKFEKLDFNKFKIKSDSMILLSNSCYSTIYDTGHYIENTGFSTNKFLIQDNRYFYTSSISLKPIYSTNWYLITNLCFDNIYYNFNGEFPKEILFVYYEDELEEHDVSTIFIVTSKYESPVDLITQDSQEFANSMFFLTKSAYSNLKKTTNTISSYKGIERLTWDSDDTYNYLGGHIMLNSLYNNKLYFIENMNFPLFTKTFYVKGLPNNLCFIS